MKRKLFWIGVPALILLVSMAYLLIAGERDAAQVRQNVLRFHEVANSNSSADQALKLKVRDGVFALIEQLFADCGSQEEALETARLNQERLAEEGTRILRENGKDEPVQVLIGTRWFPTKQYGDLSFPAGQYQAVSIAIGEGAGENFWCVLYPALCVAPAVAEAECDQEMAAVVGEGSTAFLKKNDQKQQIKFALVEWFENIRQKFMKS